MIKIPESDVPSGLLTAQQQKQFLSKDQIPEQHYKNNFVEFKDSKESSGYSGSLGDICQQSQSQHMLLSTRKSVRIINKKLKTNFESMSSQLYRQTVHDTSMSQILRKQRLRETFSESQKTLTEKLQKPSQSTVRRVEVSIQSQNLHYKVVEESKETWIPTMSILKFKNGTLLRKYFESFL